MIEYDKLDAGIVDKVRLMVQNGFNTTDSGDGKKVDMECSLPFPHIFAIGNPNSMVEDCEKLQELFPDAIIEASWSVGGPLVLMVMWEEE